MRLKNDNVNPDGSFRLKNVDSEELEGGTLLILKYVKEEPKKVKKSSRKKKGEK